MATTTRGLFTVTLLVAGMVAGCAASGGDDVLAESEAALEERDVTTPAPTPADCQAEYQYCRRELGKDKLGDGTLDPYLPPDLAGCEQSFRNCTNRAREADKRP